MLHSFFVVFGSLMELLEMRERDGIFASRMGMSLAEGCIFVLREEEEELDGEKDPPLWYPTRGIASRSQPLFSTLTSHYKLVNTNILAG
jgi:hypothetical protein